MRLPGVRAPPTFPVTGGLFEGDRLRGKVLQGGDDWTVKRSDGVVKLDLRITLETDDGALVHMTFEGIRDDRAPGSPYFRTRAAARARGGVERVRREIAFVYDAVHPTERRFDFPRFTIELIEDAIEAIRGGIDLMPYRIEFDRARIESTIARIESMRA
jgi:Protein of unknown function (DUF3237)